MVCVCMCVCVCACARACTHQQSDDETMVKAVLIVSSAAMMDTQVVKLHKGEQQCYTLELKLG